jgi:hypothetical protein
MVYDFVESIRLEAVFVFCFLFLFSTFFYYPLLFIPFLLIGTTAPFS